MSFKALQMARVRRAAAAEDRAALRSTLNGILRTLAAAAVSAALSFAAWQAWTWATRSEAFALRRVVFTGLVHAREPALLEASGLAQGKNLFRLDLARAARALQAQPWVASARLERRLPGTVLVAVTEHRPAALVRFGALYVLDEEGRIFKRAEPDDRLDLPIIAGLSRDAWLDRKPELQLRLYGALHLLDTWQAAGFALASLSELRLDEGGGFTLFDRGGGSLQEIRLGQNDISLELQRLTQIRAALARRGERATRIDLDNPARPDQAAATLADKR
ncbi:MAG TPA: FtsQ-type POTRA domain-containing protein [Myxococcales bacterium]